jgi:hypothetical protein
MLKNGGFRLVVAALIVGLLGFALPASSIFQSPAVATIDASSTKGDQLMVCVDWTTKEIKYSKNWETCPSKHQNIMLGLEGPQGETGPQGPRGYSGSGSAGPAGATTSLWDSLSTCYQKLQAALQAGFIMAYKVDRDDFELATGCVVEDIKDTVRTQSYVNKGLPTITDWELVSVNEPTEGEGYCVGATCISQAGGWATYKLTIANSDALSAVTDNMTGLKANAGYCVGRFSGEYMQPLGNDQFLARFGYQVSEQWAYVELELRFKHYSYSECQELDLLRPAITVYEEPSKLDVNSDYLASWGW